MITERDILRSIGAGQDPDEERVADHLTARLTFASPDWSLEQAAATMVRGGFRHLVVVEHAAPWRDALDARHRPGVVRRRRQLRAAGRRRPASRAERPAYAAPGAATADRGGHL